MPTPRPSRTARRFYRWTRNLHLYFGLFVSPFVLAYAVSAIQLNHSLMPWGGRAAPARARHVVRVVVTDAADGLAVAAQVRQQIGIAGEIGYVNRKPGGTRVSFPVESPGHTTQVKVDLAAGLATIEQKDTGVWDALVYLHKMPGPHNANIRGNWLFTRLWGWLADATVYLLLFLTASGVYLWTILKADRRIGLRVLAAGVLSFLAIVVAIVS
ncbi:hypothetical protein BH11GEM1_BH11GEM1_17120 [soil metagenome]